MDKLEELRQRLLTFENSDRSSLDGLISEWEGPFRDEFDEVEGDYMTDVVALRGVLLDLAGNIVDQAHEANREQELLNEEAEEALLEDQAGDNEGNG